MFAAVAVTPLINSINLERMQHRVDCDARVCSRAMSKIIKNQINAPSVRAPVVDKLTFVLPWRKGRQYSVALPEPVEERIKQALADGKCSTWYTKGRRYVFSIRYRFSNGSEAKIQIGATRPDTQKGGIRIELNPASLTAEDFTALHKFMRGIIGKKYKNLLISPVINRIDFAVDIENLLLSDILVDFNHSQRVTMFGKRLSRGGTLETLNFGSMTSAYMATVYDKSTQRIHSALKALGRDGLKTDELRQNVIKQLKLMKGEPPVVRVEVRGKKLGLPLPELVHQRNRFAAFKFTSIADLDDLPAWVRVAFLALYRDMGLKAALETFRGKKVYAKLKTLTSTQPAWWQPNDLWTRSCDSLRQKGIFPAAAFDAEGDEDDEEE